MIDLSTRCTQYVVMGWSVLERERFSRSISRAVGFFGKNQKQ